MGGGESVCVPGGAHSARRALLAEIVSCLPQLFGPAELKRDVSFGASQSRDSSHLVAGDDHVGRPFARPAATMQGMLPQGGMPQTAPMWACSNCGTFTASRHSCSRCTLPKGGRREGDWDCQQCAAVNFSSKMVCYRCNVPRARRSDVWCCTGCGAWEHAQFAFCSRCHLPKGGRRDGDWDCKQCSAVNFASKMSCYRCGRARQERQGTEAWVCPRCGAVSASRHACSRRLLKLRMSVSSLVGDAIANRASPSATGRRQRGRRAVGAVARSEQLSRAAGGEASSERKVRAKMRRRQSPCEPRYTQEDTRSVGRRTGRGDSITCRRCGPSRENYMAQA